MARDVPPINRQCSCGGFAPIERDRQGALEASSQLVGTATAARFEFRRIGRRSRFAGLDRHRSRDLGPYQAAIAAVAAGAEL